MFHVTAKSQLSADSKQLLVCECFPFHVFQILQKTRIIVCFTFLNINL